jgi:hypothetical protein
VRLLTRTLFPAVLLAAAANAATLFPGTPVADEFVLGPTSPGKWGAPEMGTGATVSWSLMDSGLSCAVDFVGCTTTALSSFMPVGFLTQIQNAFLAWSAVANLTFVEVADCGAAFNAACVGGDIRIGAHAFDGASGTLAHGFYPPANGTTAAGDIHFDIAETWVIGFAGPGIDIFQVMAHELGHALGLDHTAVAGSLMNSFYSEAFTGPQADDIAGMQSIYGPALSEVPEPGGIVLMSGGLLLLLAAKRRAS